MKSSKQSIDDVIDYVYKKKRRPDIDRDILSSMKRWLREKDYLCRKNHLQGSEDYDWDSFLYLNQRVVEENQVHLETSFSDVYDLLALDCKINQFVDDNFDILNPPNSGPELSNKFCGIVRSRPARYLFDFFAFHSKSGEGNDWADIFGRKKTNLLVDYFLESFIEINTNKPIDTGDECHLLAGNGFTMEIVKQGEAGYCNMAILERAFGMQLPELKASGKDMRKDFEDVAMRVTDIVGEQDRPKLEETIKSGRFLVIRGLENHVDMKYFDQAKNIIIRKCQNRLNRTERKEDADRLVFDIHDFSFEELLSLYEAFGKSQSAKDDTGRLYDVYKRTPAYTRILALAALNGGDALKKDRIMYEKRKDSLASRANIRTCFTTNYDMFCDHFFRCPVVHLHGSFKPPMCTADDHGISDCVDEAETLKQVQLNIESRLLIGIPKANLDRFEPELDRLRSIGGTLLVFGFSGDYDNHISRRISENERIDKIVYFCHNLSKKVKDESERNVKLDAFWKFSRMKKSIDILDSARLFE